MKKLIIILLLLASNFFSEAKTYLQLSDSAEVTLITCTPGTELYSIFGHSAIRIKDPVYLLDRVYNFGTFDFNTPNFYVKFVKGRLDYMLSTSKYKYFEYSYKVENRGVVEQKLNINQNPTEIRRQQCKRGCFVLQYL